MKVLLKTTSQYISTQTHLHYNQDCSSQLSYHKIKLLVVELNVFVLVSCGIVVMRNSHHAVFPKRLYTLAVQTRTVSQITNNYLSLDIFPTGIIFNNLVSIICVKFEQYQFRTSCTYKKYGQSYSYIPLKTHVFEV